MWIVSEGYPKLRKRTLLRSVAAWVCASLLLLFGGFWVLFAVYALTRPDQEAKWAGGIFGVLGGLLPLAAAAALALLGIRGIVRLSQWRILVGLVIANPNLAPEQVALATGKTPAWADRALAEALRLGALAGAAPAAPASIPQAERLDGSLEGRCFKGTWQVETKLGCGAMGAVYRARHLRTGRKYALKVMLSGAQLSSEALKRFQREATAASALGHPHIIAVHDFDVTESGLQFIVMDHLEGETLAHRLNRHGTLPWSAAQRVALEIGDALAVAHDHGLLHRDVKPDNIFLATSSGDGESAVLVDFGLVKPLDPSASRVTATGMAVGTPLYMSPEQARGEVIDPRSDEFGLAAVVFEMVTGAPPFMDRTLAEVYARLLREPAPSTSAVAPAACPPGLDPVLARALASTPQERYPTVREFITALSQIRPVQRRLTHVM